MARKWILYALFTAIAISGLAACSNNENASSGSPTSGAAGASPGETAAVADPLGKYEKPITVTQVLGTRPPEDPKTPKGLTPEQNGYVKDLKEMLNIELKYLWTVPSDQFEQKFSLALASGDLPDVMQVDPRTFGKLQSQGMLADLTEVYDKYASPTLKQYMQSDGGFAMKTVTKDEKLMAIPSFADPYLSTQLIWIRKDWLDKLQLNPPKSIDDLEKIAEAFVNQDPGNNERYGIAMQKSLIYWGFDARGLFNGYGAAPKSWLMGEDGTLVAGEIQPEAKDALARMQSWYKKGILDQEFAFKDENKVAEDIIAGRVGITYGEWWDSNWPLNLNKEKDPGAEWEAYPIPSLDGQPGKSMVQKLRMDTVVVVNKKAKNPEAAIKMINFYLEMGKKAYADKTRPENGYVYSWFTPKVNNPGLFDTIYEEVNKAIDANQSEIVVTDENYKDIQDVFEATKKYLNGDKSPSNWGLYYSRAAKNGGWGQSRQIRDNKMVFFDEFYGVPTPAQVEKGPQLDKLMDETYLKIIMGASLDEFDKYVNSWGNLGGDQITKEVNEWYATGAVK